jgi:hypothetical protein
MLNALVASAPRRDDDAFRRIAPGDFHFAPRHSTRPDRWRAKNTFQIGDSQT